MQILVVEDERMLAESLKEILEKNGHAECAFPCGFRTYGCAVFRGLSHLSDRSRRKRGDIESFRAGLLFKRR